MGNQIAAKQTFAKADNPDREEFYREVGLLTKLLHPCILNVYGVCYGAEESMFMVMEFCGGGDLEGFFKKKEFTEGEFLRVMQDILSGVSHLHWQGIAHRDLTPANVLLETGTNKAKIADFGLAKQNRTSVTRNAGTPAYMPPEMFSDDDAPATKANIFAVDIYAIAVIMCQLGYS